MTDSHGTLGKTIGEIAKYIHIIAKVATGEFADVKPGRRSLAM